MLNAGPLASYIGFTEEEVKSLCETYKKDFTEVKRWYDGYQLGEYHVYNPNTVVSLMTDGSFQSYWSGTASYDSTVPLINMNFVFIPKPEYKNDYPALVVELKWNKSAKSALQQVKDRRYPDPIQNYMGDILLVGINYNKKDKKHECVIEAYQKR